MSKILQFEQLLHPNQAVPQLWQPHQENGSFERRIVKLTSDDTFDETPDSFGLMYRVDDKMDEFSLKYNFMNNGLLAPL